MENKLRKEVLDKVLSTQKDNIVLEVGTGFGKTLLALRKLEQLYLIDYKILIVMPRNVLIQNWIEEFKKWHYEDMLNNVTFTTYVSLYKHAGKWDAVIMDECHHLSERCQEALKSFKIRHCMFLSATLKKEHRWFINNYCNNNVEWISVNVKKAIENDVLPEPKILLMPMDVSDKLDPRFVNDGILWYPKKAWKKMKNIKRVPYKDKWKWKGSKTPYALVCTERQYYNELSGLIDWYKRKSYSPIMKNMWLHACNERLKVLASWKIPTVLGILNATSKARSITFCASIEDSELLLIPCVNSKVGDTNLIKFNKGKINRIACVGMLDEGE